VQQTRETVCNKNIPHLMQKQRHKFPRQKCQHTNHHAVSMFTTKANITSYIHQNNCTCSLKRRAITVERVTGIFTAQHTLKQCLDVVWRVLTGEQAEHWCLHCLHVNLSTPLCNTYSCLFRYQYHNSTLVGILDNWTATPSMFCV